MMSIIISVLCVIFSFVFSLVEAIGHLIKSCLGGGITAIHVGYSECGLMTALCLNIILGMVVTYLMYVSKFFNFKSLNLELFWLWYCGICVLSFSSLHPTFFRNCPHTATTRQSLIGCDCMWVRSFVTFIYYWTVLCK